MHPRIVLAIARKDLVDALKNMYLLFAIILPIAMSLLFRVIFPSDSGSGGSGGFLDIAVYDPGESQLVQYLMDSKQFSMFFVGSADEVRALVQKDKLGGLVVPATFDAEVLAGQQPELVVYINPQRGGLRETAFRQLVEAGLRSLAGQAMPANVTVIDATGSDERQLCVEPVELLPDPLPGHVPDHGGRLCRPLHPGGGEGEEDAQGHPGLARHLHRRGGGQGAGRALLRLLVAAVLMVLNNGFTGNIRWSSPRSCWAPSSWCWSAC